MIKFWKSASKGKSGFPVRPPENTDVINNDNLSFHETEPIDKSIFKKESRLSLELNDVIHDTNALKYFVQFMESIGKIILIRCWLDLDQFSKYVNNRGNISDSEVMNEQQIRLAANLDSLPISTQECSSSSLINERIIGSVNIDDRSLSVTELAVSLFKKYVALEAPHAVDIPDDVRKTIISNICHPEDQITAECFKPVQNLLLSQLEKDYFTNFQQSPLYVKAQIDILTSGTINLTDILYNETLLFYFTEYLEQEHCSVLLEFLMAVMHFRDNLMSSKDISPEQAQQDAIILYDKYFSLQATTPVGFSSDVRLQIENKICRDGGPQHDCFDIPFQCVYKTLSKYVKTFLDSEMYYKYLSEMIKSVDEMSSHRRTQSDCSSEFSISTSNTLLAMGDLPFHKKKRNYSVPDMTIDSNQLYNADSLWQRKKCDGLSIGRINSLGRFESKFEPDPDKKQRSVFKKMVSKLVPSSSHVEEEMAWQIAHMIVKDVTDLTMAPPEND